jgi:UDPglucose--hexose-1-phosphate uridylyltransferase
MDIPHRRYNVLLDEWIIVAAQRVHRPWAGAVEKVCCTVRVCAHRVCVQSSASARPEHDLSNPLSPGGLRPDGTRTPMYEHTYVFDNDYPALLPGPLPPIEPSIMPSDLFQSMAIRGECQVMYAMACAQKNVNLIVLCSSHPVCK